MRVGVDFIMFDASASTTSSSMDGVFLVVHSGEPHRSKLDGVAYFLTEATRDVVVVGRCVVVGWRRRFQTCFTGMNVENYDEFCGRVVEGVVLRGKEHVAEVRRGRILTSTKTSAQYKLRNLQHTDYYVFF